MEKWKIGVIALLVAGLGGYGLLQNPPPPAAPPISEAPNATPTPSRFLGKKALSADLPEWTNIKNWANVTGAPPTLGSLKGKVALVEIFRTGCSHCSDAAPFMEKLYESNKKRGFEMVAIQSPGAKDDPQNPETRWADVRKWLAERGVKYPVGMDDKSVWFQGQLKGTHYPTILLFGTDGTVKFAQSGHDAEKAIALAVEVEKLLPSKDPLAKRAQDLMKWLSQFMPVSPDPAMQKAVVDDLEQRLKTAK